MRRSGLPLVVAAVLTSVLAVPGVAAASVSMPHPLPAPRVGPVLPAPAPLPPVDRVFVLGDSLTVGTLQYGDPGYLRAAAASADVALWPAPSAKVGRRVAEGFSILRSQHALPSAVLVALGTNDWTATSGAAAGWVRTVRGLVGPSTTIYWVNLSLTGSRYAAALDRINSGLLAGVRADNTAEQAAGAAGASRVLDWRRYTVDHGIANGRDGIHYPLVGYHQRAAFYIGALVASPEYAEYVVA